MSVGDQCANVSITSGNHLHLKIMKMLKFNYEYTVSFVSRHQSKRGVCSTPSKLNVINYVCAFMQIYANCIQPFALATRFWRCHKVFPWKITISFD
jgi:hypothetical protein